MSDTLVDTKSELRRIQLTGLVQFSDVLDCYPACFAGNRLNLLFLEDAWAITAPDEYLRHLVAPSLSEERREYVVDRYPFWPFPVFTVNDRPDPWAVSYRLFERFDEATRILPIQSEIGWMIEGKIKQHTPDIVVLIIVDGLSYYDLAEDIESEPYLVNGVSITEFGYRQVVGKPQVARRLFAVGYKNQIGYTYFAPESNNLANDILSLFSFSQVVKVKAFDEILRHLNSLRLVKGYIQIAMPGLDQLCHAHHDRPPRDHYLQTILKRFDSLIDCLTKYNRRVLAFLTADHGILWREHIEDKIEIVGDLLPEDIRSARYLRGSLLRDYGRCCNSLGQNYTLLRAPYLTRKLRNNEWGVHGGISAWESVVPLLTRIA